MEITPKIIRSHKRRTLSISVNSDAVLVARAPLFMSDIKILKFLTEHTAWIEKAVMERQKVNAEIPKKQFIHGEEFLYLGVSYPLKVVSELKRPLEFDNGFFLHLHHQERGKLIFERWYKTEAKKIFLGRIDFYAKIMGVKFCGLKVTNPIRQWGCCNSKDSISLNWKLIMAPLHVLDYVVIHELAHIIHKNHSKRFWAKVGKFDPEYKSNKLWLKNKGHILNI